jgi:1-acyl-sn-glycerol-3-phosphate acyltransferase
MRGTKRTWIGSALWLPWSLIAWVLSIGWLVTLTLACIPIAVFIPFERFQHRLPHAIMGMTTLFSFSPIRTHVDPRYRFDRVSVFTQNHVSMFDGIIAVGAIRVPLCGLENAAHLKVPGYGWLLRMANSIAVRPSNGGGRYREIARAFLERASRGINILTFPEGHRTLDGNLRAFKRGIFRIARDAGLPIVPIAVRGIHKVLPKGTIIIRPAPIEVYIAPQIQTEGLTDEQLPVLMERVRTVMEAWIERREQLGHLCLEPIEPVHTGTGSGGGGDVLAVGAGPTTVVSTTG